MIAALLSGSLVGFSLGLIGGGGSILATPLLLYVVGIHQPHIAIGTGALAVSASAYINLLAHARKGHVVWNSAALFAVVGTGGAYFGSTLGKAMDGERLLFLFAILMFVVGALMLRPRLPASHLRPFSMQTAAATALAALGAGLASGFFGIGGGFLIVPALIFATGMPTINAIGSSLLAVGTFGLATALNYAAAGLVDWRIAAEFVAGGTGGGMLGMVLATRLSGQRQTLSRIFALVVFSVAGYLIFRSKPW